MILNLVEIVGQHTGINVDKTKQKVNKRHKKDFLYSEKKKLLIITQIFFIGFGKLLGVHNIQIDENAVPAAHSLKGFLLFT